MFLSKNEKIIKNWQERYLIKEISNVDNLKYVLQHKKAVYCGIDPTNDSLHFGHLVPLKLLKEFSILGCPIFIIVGEATARIGDPSFRDTQRINLNIKKIKENTIKIQKQLKKLLPNATILNNNDWYKRMTVLDFFVNVSSLFTVKKILQKESFAHAFDKDILFHSHFSYILMQAYDFYFLWKKYNCYLEIGGSDQFPNIVFGIDLIRKLTKENVPACGVTTNLLLNFKGQKISKSTDKNNIWLDNYKNSFYQIYQFFYNLDDKTTQTWLNMFFSFNYSLQEINPKEKKERKLQKKLFFLLIELIFDNEIKKQIQECFLFYKNPFLTEKQWKLIQKLNFINHFIFNKSIFLKKTVFDLLKETKIVNSNSAAKQLILQKAIFINNILVKKNSFVLEFLKKDQINFFLKKGKKELILVKIN